MTSNSVLSDSPALRGYWYAVAESTELDQVPVHVRLLGDDYVLYRPDGGSVVAAPDRCPHREAPLSLGRMEQGCLVCCYHGWTFGDNGQCVRVPSSESDARTPPKSHLATVHATERYGLVWICPGEPVAGIPEIAADRRPELPPHQHRRGHMDRLRHADDGQLPRHLPLPLRARRHLRHRGQPAGAEDRHAPARRRLPRLRVRGRGGQHARRHLVGHRCQGHHTADDHRVQPAVHGALARSTTRPGSTTSSCCAARRSTTSRRTSRS